MKTEYIVEAIQNQSTLVFWAEYKYNFISETL